MNDWDWHGIITLLFWLVMLGVAIWWLGNEVHAW